MFTMKANRTLRVAANVRAELARRNLSTRALAQAIGINRVTLGRRVNGFTSFSIDELERIADHLGITVDDLVADQYEGRSA